MRIDRMLAITILLLSRDRVSAKELAGRFEVSVRTIYRDMEAINIAGIPIISYPGAEGGFGIMEGFKLDRQIFTTQDMISILSPLEGINKAFKSEGITKVIDKIHSLIPGNEKKNVSETLNRMIIDIQPWGRSDKWKAIFKEIQNAIERQKIIKLSYVNSNGEASERQVEPMTLIFKSHTWYLWGYCLEKSDYRMFKISRMQNLTILNKSFIHRGDSYQEPEEFTGDVIPIKLRCSKAFKAKAIEYFHQDHLEEKEDGIYINLNYPTGSWVKEFVLSLGANIEILEPKWLRNEIKEEIIKQLEFYNN